MVFSPSKPESTCWHVFCGFINNWWLICSLFGRSHPFKNFHSDKNFCEVLLFFFQILKAAECAFLQDISFRCPDTFSSILQNTPQKHFKNRSFSQNSSLLLLLWKNTPFPTFKCSLYAFNVHFLWQKTFISHSSKLLLMLLQYTSFVVTVTWRRSNKWSSAMLSLSKYPLLLTDICNYNILKYLNKL